MVFWTDLAAGAPHKPLVVGLPMKPAQANPTLATLSFIMALGKIQEFV